MKRVYVVRHAQAIGKDLGIPDFERSLVPKGVKQSRRAGKRLMQEKPASPVLVSSPANRALETAHLVAREMDYPSEKILLREGIYDAADGAHFVDILRELDDRYATAVLFGHEPTLSEFVRRLAGSFAEDFPKGGTVGVEFPDDIWATVGDRPGKLFYFDARPNKTERKRLEKHLAKQIEQDVSDSVAAAVARYSPQAPGKMKKAIRSAGKEVAGRLLEIVGPRKLVHQYNAKQASRSESEPEPAAVAEDPAAAISDADRTET